MKIAVAGNGNVAHHLIPALQRNSEIVQVTTDAGNFVLTADVYFLLVPDSTLYDIAKTLRLPEKTIVHVSGATPLDVLKPISGNTGVMYFIQTFGKSAPQLDFSRIPVCVEASNIETEKLLMELACELSDNVCKATSEQRARIHLAAVFTNNFTNALYGIAEKILPQNDLSLLYPLIDETVRKIKTIPAQQAQTGPAVRRDKKTIEKHLQLLQSEPQLQELYRQFTEIIQASTYDAF
ncbi:MAG: DUF2520 domain-containing protein [Bacteroidales bacterium]|jgi:predicted short-subunit dehydrogenase-like oxidoreductase (DUF2520 family)|nr:DUF2520 domain-containing protein [Bacteroidales bacterium]